MKPFVLILIALISAITIYNLLLIILKIRKIDVRFSYTQLTALMTAWAVLLSLLCWAYGSFEDRNIVNVNSTDPLHYEFDGELSGKTSLSTSNSPAGEDNTIFDNYVILRTILTNSSDDEAILTVFSATANNIKPISKPVILANATIEDNCIILTVYNNGWSKIDKINIVISGDSSFQKLIGKDSYEITYDDLDPGEKREMVLLSMNDISNSNLPKVFYDVYFLDYYIQYGENDIQNSLGFAIIGNCQFCEPYSAKLGIIKPEYYGIVFSTAYSEANESMMIDYAIPAHDTVFFDILVAPDRSCIFDLSIDLTINNTYQISICKNRTFKVSINYDYKIYDGRVKNNVEYFENHSKFYFPILYLK